MNKELKRYMDKSKRELEDRIAAIRKAIDSEEGVNLKLEKEISKNKGKLQLQKNLYKKLEKLGV